MSMEWACPSCHGTLEKETDNLRCISCNREYGVVAGIPDLRMAAPTWIDFDADRERALLIDELVKSDGLASAIVDVFVTSRGKTVEQAKYRCQQIFQGIEKNVSEIHNWLAPAFVSKDTIEIGCGGGQLLAAAASGGKVIAGLDASLEWLVIAKHLVRRSGGNPVLAAGLAEHLPIADGAMGGVISLDVLEHVVDQGAFVSEITRVMRTGGSFALATPNRFTLGLEPHVSVWGVGFLPVRLQKPWVKLISGKSYTYTRLLSVFETRNLFSKNGDLTLTVKFPPISNVDLSLFSPGKAMLAKLYNVLIRTTLVQSMAPFFGAFYRITGVKS
ncbi:MAG: methyltransferase domain-containing protein [Alphaproteobacteria bacterium]|nr:methyltransferase domain-containing protein [Alphaproteobacteria bacterium]